jgi:hypothetical protein
MNSLLAALFMLSFCGLFLAGTVTVAKPLYAESPNNDRDLILSFGKDRSLDIVFGSAGAGGPCQLRGPLGEKAVVPGAQFYLDRKRGGRVISSVDVDVPEPDNRWSWWYHSITETLPKHWAGSVPGKAQLILRITPDRRIAIVKEIAFTPAINKMGHFDASNETRNAFMSAVKNCLTSMSGPNMPEFPVREAVFGK